MLTNDSCDSLKDELARYAAERAATWQRRCGWWFMWATVSCFVLLVSVTLATGSRGSTAGQWLMKQLKQLPIGMARVSYHPNDYRAFIFEDDTYELYGPYDPNYAPRYAEVLESPEQFVELTVLVWDRPRMYGWWGLTREWLPLEFAWEAWSDPMNRAPPNHAVYDQIRVEIVDDLCREYAFSCGRYREAIAAGATVDQAMGMFHETYAVTRIVWSGYAHNAVTIAALVLLQLSLWRMFVARRQCIRWRRMWQRMKCPMCSYDLRGTTEPRCPECGTLFTADSP